MQLIKIFSDTARRAARRSQQQQLDTPAVEGMRLTTC